MGGYFANVKIDNTRQQTALRMPYEIVLGTVGPVTFSSRIVYFNRVFESGRMDGDPLSPGKSGTWNSIVEVVC